MIQLNTRGMKQAGLKMIMAAATLAALSGNAMADGGSFVVDAKDNSTGGGTLLDTGLVFGAGDQFSVTTTGSWTGDVSGTGFCYEVTAAGSTCGSDSVFPKYSLVGRFDNGDYFLIGQGGTFTSTGGELYLGFYDVDSGNNRGTVTAAITAVPEPSTYAMMLAGLALLVVRRRRQS